MAVKSASVMILVNAHATIHQQRKSSVNLPLLFQHPTSVVWTVMWISSVPLTLMMAAWKTPTVSAANVMANLPVPGVTNATTHRLSGRTVARIPWDRRHECRYAKARLRTAASVAMIETTLPTSASRANKNAPLASTSARKEVGCAPTTAVMPVRLFLNRCVAARWQIRKSGISLMIALFVGIRVDVLERIACAVTS